MRIQNFLQAIIKYASRFVQPERVLIAILIAVLLWLAPLLVQPPLSNTEKVRKPLQEAGGIKLVSAVEANAPNCSPSCQEQECVNWKPGPSPACPRPGPGGGCCLEYETRCDPGCEDPGPVYQPPTISAALNCTNSGSNGWCIGDLTLNLSASDPQGQSVTISGTVGAQAFTCPAGATSCSIAISNEAGGTITYRVVSATGLSANGSTAYKLDYSDPYFSGSVSGVPGTNNWYRSNATFNITAADAASGIASFTAAIDGGAPAAVSGPLLFGDGIHVIELSATDYAGFGAQATQIIQVDTITPTLNIAVSGTSGSNGWYVSNVTVTPSASDGGSGLYALEVNKDGSGYVPYTAPVVFTDGLHTWQFRATDYAGNVTETAQQAIKVDATTPSLSTSTSGTSGSNGWYVSNVTVTPSVSDSGSGLSAFVVSTDGGAYSAYLNPIFFTEGFHTVRFRATDYAGNVTETALQTVNVDTTTPAISLTITGTVGKNGWYKTNVTVKANVSDATSAVGLVEASADGGAWAALSQLSFGDGLHSYQFKVTDNAGNNTTVPLQNIKIDTIAPFIDMTEELSLGETVYYDLQDNGSGLSIYRAVIEDDDERYQKIVWLDLLTGNKLRDQIRWDGRFADGTQAGWGQYFITLKISDAAGNETMRSAVVTVNPLSFLEEIPAFTPPPSTTLPASEPGADAPPAATFGGENNNASGGETVTTNEGGQSNPASDATTTSSTAGNIPNPFANVTTLTGPGSSADTGGQGLPGNLLGTIGMVAAGAIAYETYRRREEDGQPVLNSGVINPVISSGADKGLSMPVAPVIPSQPAAGGPPWWEWIVQTWQSGVTAVQQILDSAKQKLQDSPIGQAIPELTWTPLTPTESQTLLQNVTSFSSQGATAATFLQQQNTSFGYFPQNTGAGWTMLNSMILQPGVNLNSPFNNSLIIHEALHLEQGYLTRFSVYGELLAWQLQYQAYYDATGKHFGEKGADFYDPADPIKSANWEKNWLALSQLDPNSLQDLAIAQQLMVDIDPQYRSKLLPLEPYTKTVATQVTKFGDAASNAINSGAQKASTAITQNGQALANKLTDLGTSAANRITQASTAAAKAVTAAGQTVAKAVTQVSQAASNVIKQGGQAVANLASKISPNLGSSIVKTSNAVASIAVKTGQFVSTATKAVSQAASNAITKGGQAAAKVVTSASKAAANAVTNVSKAAATTVTKVAQSAGNAVKSVASSISKFFWKP
jgi:hypothetical protein